jgi:hypothetical protein
METTLIRKAVLNHLTNTGVQVKDDAAAGPYPGSCIICTDNTLSPLVNVLPPIFKGTCSRGWFLVSAAEVRQIVIGGALVETVVASTRYKVTIWNGDTYEGQKQETYQYAYTTPAVLSGNAETDRLALYTQLVNKINAHTANKVTAYLAYKVAFTTGSVALPQIGEIVTQETSTLKLKIARLDCHTSDFTATSAEGEVWLYDPTDHAITTWESGAKTLTGATSGCTMATAAALTTGAGIVIVDDAGYYAARPNSKRGPSYVGMTDGWTVATLESIYNQTASVAVGTDGPYTLVGLAPIISRGIGSRLVEDSPVFGPDGVTLVTGEAHMETTGTFDATHTYSTLILEVNNEPSDTNITGYTKRAPVYYVVYLDESNTDDYVDDFVDAVEASLAITILHA